MSDRLPRLVLGTLPFGGVVSGRDAHALLDQALTGGVRAFDVSHLYGGGLAMQILRDALRGLEGVEIWCSVGLEQRPDPNGVFGVEMTAITEESIGTKVGSALQRLGRDFLSTLNIHAFDHSTPLEETLAALSAVKERGVIQRVSFSNLSDSEAALIVELDTKHVVDFVQLHGNVLERRLINTSGERFRADGRGVACFRALARGLLTRGYSPSNPRPADSRATRGWRLNRYLSDDYLMGLHELFQRLNLADIGPVDFALSWLIHNGAADSAVVGVRSSAQLAEVLEWQAGRRTLSGGELDTIIPASLLAYVDHLPVDHFER